MKKKRTTKCKRLMRFTPRQLALLKDLSEGTSVTRAYRSSASVEDGDSGQHMPSLAKHTPEPTSQILDKCGLSLEVLIEQHLKPMLKAPPGRFLSSQGRVTGKQIVAAVETNRRALDTALRLHDAFPPKAKPSAPAKGGFVNVLVVDLPRPDRSASEIELSPGRDMEETTAPAAYPGSGGSPVVRPAAPLMLPSNETPDNCPKTRLFFDYP
jgi:hypothetical protein